MKKKKALSFRPQSFEKEAWNTNMLVCGIDEVGRGCLAGPLVVSAAVLFKNKKHPLLKDSKVLAPEQRLIAFEWLKKNSYSATIFVSSQTIDRCNIYQATLYGMSRAFHKLLVQYPFLHDQLRYILVDAMPLSIPQSLHREHVTVHNFPFGEQISNSIAAASIIAKVTRDQFMESTIAPLFPAFQLHQHKGYGTADHQEHLQNHGPTIIHRATFLNSHQQKHAELAAQLSLLEE